MIKAFFLGTVLQAIGLMATAQTLQTDSTIITMQQELKYNFAQLKQKTVPAYFMSLRMVDEQTLTVSAGFGVAAAGSVHNRYIVPTVRLGNKDLDNYKYENQGKDDPNNRYAVGNPVAENGRPLRQLRDEIWTATRQRYDIAVDRYEEAKAKTNTDAEYEDSAACFCDAPVEKYYEPELKPWVVDTTAWKERLAKVSLVFKECNLLEEQSVTIQFSTVRTTVVNTDGTAIAENRRCARIMLNAMIKATDGMPCPLYKDFFGYSESELPGDSVLIATAKDLVKRLLALREAPLADPYTGPAILSGSASGVFFHEIFGHRLESHRMKKGGQTFKHMVGERVLPTSFNVYCDPTMQYYGTQALNGYYKYDEEGVRGQRVTNVENGILKNFLTGRLPIDGFPQSNGHARASNGNDPVSRQSNLIVETSKPYTEAQLREMLIKEAKKQGKEYGYFFRTVTSGFTLTDYLNAFNVDPVEVYRIYVDGRKDELVRGVNLIGTPLSMFSNIEAGGDKEFTFTGSCGAESGWVPVTASSPYIYVSKIETQRTNAEKAVPRILPRPEYTKDASLNHVNKDREGDVIFKAMEDEMARTKDSLLLEDLPRPYFVDYRAVRGAIAQVSGSLGGIYRCGMDSKVAIGLVDISIGDSIVTNKMSRDHRGNPFSLTDEINYDQVRRAFWEQSDEVYKICLNQYGQKLHSLQQTPLPEEDQNIPDFLVPSAREYIEPSALTEMPDTIEMKKYVGVLSAIFAEYPEIHNSDVHYYYETEDVYRVTSSGLKLRLPKSTLTLNINGNVRTPDGSNLYDELNIIVNKPSELQSLDVLKQRTHDFCELLIKKGNAPVIKEYYVGPLMIEDEAVSEAVLRKVVFSDCIANRDLFKGSSLSSMKVGKRILDTKISIDQLTDTPEYDGVKLIGNYSVDMDGVTPEKDMTIVDNGILKQLIMSNRPAVGAMKSTGNERPMNNPYNSNTIPSTIRMTVEKPVPYEKLKAIFIKEAKKDGLDHAYIVKAPKDGYRYLVRLDLKTSAEEIVRSEDILEPSRGDLMHIITASKEQFVTNKAENKIHTQISSITPKALIIDNVEYSFKKPERAQEFQLQNPATRK